MEAELAIWILVVRIKPELHCIPIGFSMWSDLLNYFRCHVGLSFQLFLSSSDMFSLCFSLD
jgi:hypothetical protein